MSVPPHPSSDLPSPFDWKSHARPHQLPPPGDWANWLLIAGRGFGKTRTGAETLRMWVKGGLSKRIALIGETQDEVRKIMVEGPSGLIAVHPPEEKLRYEPSKKQLSWPNGAEAFCYGGDHYEQLRGPQFDTAWIDEFAKFRDPEKTWEQLMLCMRLGNLPRTIITTTPRPDDFLRKLMKADDSFVTRGTTFDNQANLAPGFLKAVKSQYMGTHLGRQELMAEILDNGHCALWTPQMIEKAQANYKEEMLQRIVVAIDPAATSHSHSDETGIIAAGQTITGDGVILEDLSLKAKPFRWACEAVSAYHGLQADRIVAEVNMGGELVEQMIRSVDARVSFKAVRATRGKIIRAAPIAALYEQEKVSHARPFPELEKQLTSYFPGKTQGSPDRMDALVWALTELMLGGELPKEGDVWI